MKTTAGKTRTTRRAKRSVRIHAMPGGERLQVRYASSLKQGLEEFYKERLLPQGASGKKVVGNTLSCTLNGEARLYRALEEYQAA